MVLRTKVFVDTSWFKAFVDEKDTFYQDASLQKERINNEQSLLITSNFILDESFTLIRVKSKLSTALLFRDIIANMEDILTVIRVTQSDEEAAWNWFPENWGKLSFTDCTSFAVMQRLGLKDALTFDEHFAKAGFKIFK